MKNSKSTKSQTIPRYRAMSARQLTQATKQYDRENLDMKGVPVPPAMQTALDRVMKRGRGRPIRGQGAAPIQITLERGLLADADKYAQKMGMSRSELIALCLRQVIEGKKKIA
jgi:hypothetical protein